nr:VRR-NUC domain-containing protein [Photobacterium damselae]
MFQQQFYAQRQVDIEQRLKQIESGQYNDWEQIYQQKKGISNYWVTWPIFTTEVLELALKHIPSSTMVVLFRRLLQDLKHNRTGMPDLIMFNEKDYLWVEIKGPGDKLQNNQLRWLQFFSQHHIPAEVAYVQWQEST